MVINIMTSSYPGRVKKEGQWTGGIELSVLTIWGFATDQIDTQ
jgi:hypothetical protein